MGDWKSSPGNQMTRGRMYPSERAFRIQDRKAMCEAKVRRLQRGLQAEPVICGELSPELGAIKWSSYISGM